MQIESVTLDTLNLYKNNPRVGDVDLIAESLETYGQYKPITVNKRDNTILAGNHTFQAAQQLGWKAIDVVYVDVDELTAAKIVAIDNRAADAGSYDDQLLLQLLKEIDDLSATGYTADDVDDLIASIEEANTPQITVEAAETIRANTYATHDPADGDNVKRIPTLTELADRYNQRATRMVILDYPNEIFVWVIDKLTEFRKEANLETNADAVKTLLEMHFKESAPNETL